MPGIYLFNRRWNLASDDLFYPGCVELAGRTLWFIPQITYYIEYQANFKCAEAQLLHVYYIGFIGIMLSILFNQLFIVIISTRGTITHTEPRRQIGKFIYVRILLVFIETIWSIIGIICLTQIKWSECSNIIFLSVCSNIIFCFVAILVLIVVVFFLLDPISHVPEGPEGVVKKRDIIYERIKSIFFCCYCFIGNSRNTNYENSYKQISSLLEMIFRGGNLTPSDVLAGIILLNIKEVDQYNREALNNRSHIRKTEKLLKNEKRSAWMNINESAYYIRYAIATYSWPY
jgi:sn1-specific diacylglycerol lipase